MQSARISHTVDERARLFVVALIPTFNRSDLLALRSLPSVASQTTPPDLILVVDDSTPMGRYSSRKVVSEFKNLNPDVDCWFLLNTRTRGASGAWNTGIYWLKSIYPTREIVIATLDDDDEWLPDHLESAVAMLTEKNLDLTATGFIRIEGSECPDKETYPPPILIEDDFLKGNPGIQGSNLVIRLESLLKAGGFDENLPSCTDRDLCLRLIDTRASYAPVSRITVRHFAEVNRKQRLSYPESRAKHNGLDVFWRKYRDRMSDEVRAISCERAERLFHWQPPEQTAKEVWLVVGIVSDADRPERVAPLLDDLTKLAQYPTVSGLDVVVLENGNVQEGRISPLAEQVRKKREDGLRIWFIPVNRQISDATAGAFGEYFSRSLGRGSIAEMRTMLQAYIYAMAQRRPGCIVWILDDDLRLGDWAFEKGCQRMVSALLECKSRGNDVVLGTYSGAGPIPTLMTLKSELLDLFYNIRFLTSLSPDKVTPNRNEENRLNLTDRPEAYHDLSINNRRHTETPLWWTPDDGETASQSLHRIAESVRDLVNGNPVFRGLRNAASLQDDLKPSKSTLRGGVTWILNSEVLAETPNLAVRFKNDDCRRSDMIWSVLLESHFSREITQLPISLLHDRSKHPVSDPWRDIVRDVRGHAVYMALNWLLQRQSDDGAQEPLVWNKEEAESFIGKFNLYLRERIDELEQSIRRAQSLLDSIHDFLSIDHFSTEWKASPTFSTDTQSIRSAMSDLTRWFYQELVESNLNELRTTPVEPVLRFLNSLWPVIKDWCKSLSEREVLLKSLAKDREENAKAGIRLLAEPRNELSPLGEGLEGVVFHDGESVFKWFDNWPLRQRKPLRESTFNILQGFQGSRSLPNVDMIKEKAGHIVLRYPYCVSGKYRGGKGPGLYQLLKDCRNHGIVFTNLHPDNLRVVGDDVLMVDVGADVAPWTPDGWKQMIRRAWLSWRWWFRRDLRELMTRSLTDETLPELEGFDGLVHALDDPPATDALDQYLVDKVSTLKADSCLDYGCGKGQLVSELADRGIQATGYDPDPSLLDRWKQSNHDHPSALFGGHTLLKSMIIQQQKFDAVVCSLVLCTLQDSDYENAITDLRRLTKDSGKVFVAICNPIQTFGGSTPLKFRPKILDRDYDEVFEWTGRHWETGNQRVDVHRPIRVIERDLARNGLSVISIWHSSTFDLERFEPASDFIVLELEPAQATLPVTLAIKTCDMDHATIEEQVRHIVTQLESPEVFEERLLIVDSKQDGFTRAYDSGNRPALEAKIERLIRFRYIDRVVYSSTDPEIIERLNLEWFGVHSTATHALNGSPVAAALTMFMSVQTPYILQVDSDLMIHRAEPREGSVSRLVELLERNSQAVTISLSIAATDYWGPTEYTDVKPHRVEVRGAMFHMARLLAFRPFPNQLAGDKLQTAWYRSLDARIAVAGAKSLRIRDPNLWYMHPPNHRKIKKDEWIATLAMCRSGDVTESQFRQPEWVSPVEEWLLPNRLEPFVFVLQGRNTPLGKMRRAIDSILKQEKQEWGAIIMDDGSGSLTREWLDLALKNLDARWTIIQTPIRRRGMANLFWAVRHICANPESVIVTVDLDDCLIGSQVLSVLEDAYSEGADLTVGSLLRTDKQKKYSVSFSNPRRNFGGNIWLHLRTFKKRLFDSVPEDAFKLNGEFVPVAQDWAFMLPMVELAKHPTFIERPLYLYEPFGDGKNREEDAKRKEIITQIFAKPSLLTGNSPIDKANQTQEDGIGKA